jgi:hypothetical protein
MNTGDPPCDPTAMCIPAEWLMCQPSSSGHSPMSKTACFMSGVMFLHVDDILRSLESALQESTEEGQVLTNENVAVEYRWKMSEILRLWRSRNKFYSWGPQEDLEKAEELFEVSSSHLYPLLHLLTSNRRGKKIIRAATVKSESAARGVDVMMADIIACFVQVRDVQIVFRRPELFRCFLIRASCSSLLDW